MTTALRVAIVGLGTVGTGTFNLLQMNAQDISRRVGVPIEVRAVVGRNPETLRAVVGHSADILTDPMAVVQRADIDVVVELMGGTTVAHNLVLAAIAAGKHVVTANKALLALHGEAIFAAAEKAGVMVAFEAAVAGGIPVIKTIKEGLAANQIEYVAGIINGTCNFILSEMRDKGLSFEAVLAQAQALGYAEADPSFDIEGIDAAHKITLLASLAFGIPVRFDQAYVEGIVGLEQVDIAYAEQLGFRVKLLGIARRTADGVELRVHPTLVPRQRLIANVEGVMNAVLIKSNAAGPTLLYGPGAGGLPTASSVVADLIEVARLQAAPAHMRTPMLAFQSGSIQRLAVLPIDQIQTAFYLRCQVQDKPGVLAEITRVLADHDISIEAMVQKQTQIQTEQHTQAAEIVLLTHQCTEGPMRSAIQAIEQLRAVCGRVVSLRVEGLH
jgi:homoserine dehydrogenase